MFDSETEEKKTAGKPRAERDIAFHAMSDLEKALFVYKEGGSDYEVCEALQITRKEFQKRLDNDFEFSECVEFGREDRKSVG